MSLQYKKSSYKISLLLIVFLTAGFTACTENTGLSDLNRDLYAKYPHRFLHASLGNKSLHVLMYRNTDTLTRTQWQQNALGVAHFILSKRSYRLGFETLEFRYQNISAQIVIADTGAIEFWFNADSLKSIN